MWSYEREQALWCAELIRSGNKARCVRAGPIWQGGNRTGGGRDLAWWRCEVKLGLMQQLLTPRMGLAGPHKSHLLTNSRTGPSRHAERAVLQKRRLMIYRFFMLEVLFPKYLLLITDLIPVHPFLSARKNIQQSLIEVPQS